MEITQRHIIQTVYDKTGMNAYKKDLASAMTVAKQFGTNISQSAKYAGTVTNKSMNKMGEVITKKTATFIQNGKKMNVSWKTMGKSAKFMGASVKQAGVAMGGFSNIIKKAIGRALIVAPLWLAIRGSMMLFIRTVKDMIKAFIDLDSGLARIRTVMQGTVEEINREMIGIKRTIIDTSVRTNKSLKELAEVFYFLKTASLSSEEAMAGFIPTVNMLIATGVDAKEGTRAIAGVFNTMGAEIDGATTAVEKFTRISDILTYTYATQDVEMKELIQGYTKLAPFLSGLDDSFTDIVTTLGFLNTKMLRSGRTGRLMARSILQLTKNADKLAQEFGIVFNPNKPISFLKTIEEISKALAGQSKLTAKSTEQIRKIFATRGSAPVKLLVDDFKSLKEAIDKAGIEADGFAEKLSKIRLRTIAEQGKRLKNILNVMFHEFVAGATGQADFAKNLEELNDKLQSSIEYIRETGVVIGWLGTQFDRLKFSNWNEFLFGKKNVGYFDYANKQLEQLEKSRKVQEEKFKTQKKFNKLEEEAKKIKDNNIKLQKEEIKHEIKLMKIKGASDLDIARFKLKSLIKGRASEETEVYELQKAKNLVIQEELKYREQLANKYQKAQVDMAKKLGASEMQILDIQERQLRLREKQYAPIEYGNRLLDIQLKKEMALQNQILKRRNLFESVMEKIINADKQGRRDIAEAVTNLLPVTGDTFRNVFSNLSEGAKKVAFEMRSIFTKGQQADLFKAVIREAGGEVQRMSKQIENAISRQPEMEVQKIRAVELIIDNMQLKNADSFTMGEIGRVRDGSGEWRPVTGKIPITKSDNRLLTPREANITANVGGVTVNINADTGEKLAEITGDKVSEALKNNKQFSNLFSDLFWNQNTKGRTA